MTVITRCFLVVCLLLSAIAFQSPYINEPFQDILTRLKVYSEIGASDKVYIQTDKPYYTSGETIWLKTYVVDGIRHLQSAKSRIVYVEFISPKDSIVAERRMLITDFGAAADLRISPDWPSGKYLLRAYTQYMRNAEKQYFYQKEIPVWYQNLEDKGNPTAATGDASKVGMNSLDRPKLQFYPEGGQLVSGLSNKMGLKVTDQAGRGLELEGSITDEAGNPVAAFRSFKFGLGIVSFQPKAGEKYQARVVINDIEQTYPLPEVIAKGYVLGINNQGKSLAIKVNSNTPEGLAGAFLVGHLRGDLFFEKQFSASDASSFSVQLSTQALKDGVAHFTLYTKAGEPVCERLVFIDNPTDDLQLAIKGSPSAYGTRQEVSLALSLTDPAGTEIPADLSLSITDVAAVNHNPNEENIKSWLLLNSDLRGEIEDPGFFFAEKLNGKRRYMLDALMLTHGWRQFVWSAVQAGTVKPLEFEGEQGITISGHTSRIDQLNRPLIANTLLDFITPSIFHDEQKTDSLGQFRYGPYLFQDTVEIVLQARKLKKKKKKQKGQLDGDRYLSISIDPDTPAPPVDRYFTKINTINDNKLLQNFLSISQSRKRNDRIFDGFSVDIDEVTVTAKRKQQTIEELIESRTSYYGDPTHRILADSSLGLDGGTLFDLLARMPGVRVTGSYPTQSVQVRGSVSFQASTAPLFLLDGNPIGQDFAAAMRSNEVFFVDLISGPSAAIYGSQGSNGVIAIYSRQGQRGVQVTERKPGIINFTHPGLYKVRKFFAPNYATKKVDHQKPDLRTTLFWEPQVQLNGKKNAEVTFYTCDNAGTYLVKVEGIAKTGQAVYGTYQIQVE